MRRCLWLCVFGLLVTASPADVRAAGSVVIGEIHYHPPEGSDLEFLELWNPGGELVDLSGWSLRDAVSFEFPQGSGIAAGGRILVCGNRPAVSIRFGVDAEFVLGGWVGSLDNEGEEIQLLDADGSVVERVRYDDVAPWDARADGDGPSLERVCGTLSAGNPGNWIAATGVSPTPLLPSRFEECPAPALVPAGVTLSEIYYHPLADQDALEEFVELRNNGSAPIDLLGYRFVDGVDFAFESSWVLQPGEAVAVCRDVEQAKRRLGIERNAVGNYVGQLSNDGERITVLDADGLLVDSVEYSDRGDWPVVADGLGHSLEKIVPTAVSDDPASWTEAGLPKATEWTRVVVTAIATSSLLLVYLDGEGEVLLDDFELVQADEPATNYLPNPSFDAGIDGWMPAGNHVGSSWDGSAGIQGGALRLVATGRGSGSRNGVSIDTVPELERSGPEYKLTFHYKHVSGSTGLTCRLNVASATRGIYWTAVRAVRASPGAPNAAAADHRPPFASEPSRSPREPLSTDPVTLTARVRSDRNLQSVRLLYRVDAAAEDSVLEMVDDGLHGDGAAGDGVHGAEVPPQPHNSIVTYRIVAADAEGSERAFPPETDPAKVYGYYVNDLQPESPLPILHLLLDHRSASQPRSILAALNCQTYRPGAFAFRGDLYPATGIRQRGQSVCGSTKPYLKVNFSRGRPFGSKDKINLQSLWTDKSLVREVLAWQMFRDVGMPWCDEEFVRLHVNGKYFGLYGMLEHPDARFLERNRLNPEGNLYKAVASTEQPMANYQAGYEKKTNENNDFSDLADFLNTMHATPRNALVAFFQERADADRIVDYQLGQTLTNNSDYPHKNHYLYHDTATGKWMPLTWDMDLTYGKIWDGTYGGVLHDRMHNPGNTPWYTTSVDGGLGNHLLDKFFAQAGTWFRRAYVARLWDALQEKYTLEFFDRRIEYFRDLLIDEQAEDIKVWSRSPATADDPTAPRDFEPNLDRVREHVRQRRVYLLNYLTGRERFTGHDRLKITELMYNPAGAGEDLEFLELWNPTGKEIDVSGWTIEGIEFAFPAETRVAKDEAVIVAKEPGAFAAAHAAAPARVFGPYAGNLSNGGEILRVKDAGPGHPATVDLLRYETDGEWPRQADGGGPSIELTEVSATRDNDLGGYWRASARAGGTPGEIEGITVPRARYRRGDPTADGKSNVSDAVAVIGYLYLGAGEPACLESADANADGLVDGTDVVVLATYLFQPTAPPLPAPGPRDCAPSVRLPCARSNCE